MSCKYFLKNFVRHDEHFEFQYRSALRVSGLLNFSVDVMFVQKLLQKI